MAEGEQKYTSFPEIKPPENVEGTKRIGQKDILPNAIKNRLLGDIVQRTATATSGALAITNGNQQVLTITVSTDNDDLILGVPEIALYVTNDGTGSWQLPGGSNVDETQWQWSWFLDWHNPNVAGNNANDLYSKVYILDISAGAVNVYLDTWTRLISNKPAA